ncbi:hypothetical protein Esti_004370 [Eimeria stiedai]
MTQENSVSAFPSFFPPSVNKAKWPGDFGGVAPAEPHEAAARLPSAAAHTQHKKLHLFFCFSFLSSSKMKHGNHEERRLPDDASKRAGAVPSSTDRENDRPAAASGSLNTRAHPPSSSSSSLAHEPTDSISTPQQEAAAGSVPPVDVVVVRQQQGGAGGEGESFEGSSELNASTSQKRQQQQDGYTVIVAVRSRPSTDTSNQREGTSAPVPEPQQNEENEEETLEADEDKEASQAFPSASQGRAHREDTDGDKAVRSPPPYRHRGDAEGGDYEEEGEAHLPMPPSPKAPEQNQESSPPSSSQKPQGLTSRSPSSLASPTGVDDDKAGKPAPSPPSKSFVSKREETGDEEADEHSRTRHHRERDEPGRERTAPSTTAAISSAAAPRHHGAQAVTPPASPPPSHPDRKNEIDAGSASACHDYHHGDHRAGPHSHLQDEGRGSLSPSASPSPKPEGPRHGLEEHQRHGDEEADEHSFNMSRVSNGFQREASSGSPSPLQRGPSPPSQTELANGYPPPEGKPHPRQNHVEAPHADSGDSGFLEGSDPRPSRDAHQSGRRLPQNSSHHHHEGDDRRHQHDHENGEEASPTSSSCPEAHRHNQEAARGERATPPSPPLTHTSEEGSRQAASPSACSRRQPPHEAHEGLMFSSQDVEEGFRHVLRDSLAHRAQQARGEGADRGGADPSTATHSGSNAEGGSGEDRQGISNGVAPSHPREQPQRNGEKEIQAGGCSHPDNYGPEYQARVGAAAAAAAAEAAAAAAAAAAPRAGSHRGEGEGAGLASSLYLTSRQVGETAGPARSLHERREVNESSSASRGDRRGAPSSPLLAHPESGKDEEDQVCGPSRPPPDHEGSDRRETSVSASFPKAARLHQGHSEPPRRRHSPSSSPSRSGLDREVQGPSPPPHWKRGENNEEASSPLPSPSPSKHDATSSFKARGKEAAQSQRGPRQRSLSSSASQSEGRDGEPSDISSPASAHRRREKGGKQQALTSASPADGDWKSSEGERNEESASFASSSSPSPPSGDKSEIVQGPSPPPRASSRSKQEEEFPASSSPLPHAGDEHHDTAEPSGFFESRLAAKKRGEESHKKVPAEEAPSRSRPVSSSPSAAKHRGAAQGRRSASPSPPPDREGNDEKLQGPSPLPSSAKPRAGEEGVSPSPSPSPPRHAGKKTSGADGPHEEQGAADKPQDSSFFSSFLASRREEGGADAKGEEGFRAARRSGEKRQGAPSSQPSEPTHRGSAKNKGNSLTSSPPAEAAAEGPSPPPSMRSKQAKDREGSSSSFLQGNKNKGFSSSSPSADEHKAQGAFDPSQRGRRPHKKAQGPAVPPFDQGREGDVEGDASSTVSSPSASPSPHEAPSGQIKHSIEDKHSTSSFVGPTKKEEAQKDKASCGGSSSPSPFAGHKGDERGEKASFIRPSPQRRGSAEQKAKPSAGSAYEGREKNAQGPSSPPQKHRGTAHASPSSPSSPPSRTHEGKAAKRGNEASSSSSSSRQRPSAASPSSRQIKEKKGEGREAASGGSSSPSHAEPTPEEVARRGLIKDAFEEMRAGTDALKHVTYAAASDVSERVRTRAENALHWAQAKREAAGDAVGEAWKGTKQSGVAARKQVQKSRGKLNGLLQLVPPVSHDAQHQRLLPVQQQQRLRSAGSDPFVLGASLPIEMN